MVGAADFATLLDYRQKNWAYPFLTAQQPLPLCCHRHIFAERVGVRESPCHARDGFSMLYLKQHPPWVVFMNGSSSLLVLVCVTHGGRCRWSVVDLIL